jgi:23S rRNA pseudouridine2605 synthase
LTSEQLQNARAERWRQASNPIVTAEDARAWIEGVGLCLFLPRRAHFLAPAPSFVEAVAGAPTDAPSRETVEQATSLLHRLAVDGVVVPLNLFATGSVASDQPDFLVTREALPYVFSLIGGRNWKSGPGAKASPLMTEIWTLLNGSDALTAQEIQTALGRELTETAVLRAVVELWNGLRVIPVYDGDKTQWELTQARFATEMTESQKVAQSTALSALVSLYLESAIAASGDEVETFLSPLAARSKVREVVNGLQATRQLGLVSVAAQPLVHVAGSLPEFAEPEPVKAKVEPQATEKPPIFEKRRPDFERRPRVRREEGAERKPFQERGERRSFGRKPFEKAARPFEKKPFEKKPFEKRPFDRERGREERERRPFDKKQFDGERRPFDKERPFRERREDGEERRSFGRKTFEKTARPFGKKPVEKRPFDRERGREERRPFGKKPFEGERRPFDKERPFRERREGEGAREGRTGKGERPFRPRRGDERSGERRGERKFGGAKKFGGPKKFGTAKFSRGESREGRPERSSSGSRFERREGAGEKRPFFRERPAQGEGRSEPRSERRTGGWMSKAGRAGSPRQGKPEFRGSGKPKFRSDGGAGFKGNGKPGFKKSGGFGKSAKPFGKSGKSFGKPGKSFGKPKQGGGFKPPFRKRRDEESGSAE